MRRPRAGVVVGEERPAGLLIDLDDVVRQFDPAVKGAVEQRYGLIPGTVLKVLLEPDRLRSAVTGQQTRAEWFAGVATVLAAEVGGLAAAHALLAQWDSYRGEVVPAVRAFVRDVRAAGIPVGLATNCTDVLDDELAALGLADEFDAVIGSARLGVAKPHPDFYAAACAAIGRRPWQCLFVDDADRNVRGARAAGLVAHRYNGLPDLRYLRRSLAIGP
jgi:putative hydrolase of the HAD superfamily